MVPGWCTNVGRTKIMNKNTGSWPSVSELRFIANVRYCSWPLLCAKALRISAKRKFLQLDCAQSIIVQLKKPSTNVHHFGSAGPLPKALYQCFLAIPSLVAGSPLAPPSQPEQDFLTPWEPLPGRTLSIASACKPHQSWQR